MVSIAGERKRNRLVVVFDIDIKSYVRTTGKQMWVDPNYKAYAAAKAAMRDVARGVMLEAGICKMPAQAPLRLALFISVPSSVGHKRDLSNILKGVEDAIQHQVYDNDAWIDEIVTTRVVGKDHLAVVIIEPIKEGPRRFADWVAEVTPLSLLIHTGV